MSAKKLAATPEKWVVMVRPSLMRDYAKSGVEPNVADAWSWSMWRGYLKNDDGRLVQKWFDDGGSQAAHVHTSGHASSADLRAFANSMMPRGGWCQFMALHETLKLKGFLLFAASRTANR
jgi:ribonuclease J